MNAGIMRRAVTGCTVRRIGCRSSSRALNQDAPTHAFETKHHVHRDERLRGDVGVKISRLERMRGGGYSPDRTGLRVEIPC